MDNKNRLSDMLKNIPAEQVKFPVFQAMPVPNGMLLTIIRSDIEQAQIFVSRDNMDKLFLIWGVKASDALLVALAKMRLDEQKLGSIRDKVKRGILSPESIGGLGEDNV